MNFLLFTSQEKMKSALDSMMEKRGAFDKMKKNYEDAVECIQVTCRGSSLVHLLSVSAALSFYFSKPR